MTMRLHDTARREVVPFEPGPVVRMYVCGITPYDATHLGHANTYLTYDLLVRRLEDLGHEVISATSASRALEILGNGRRVDLLITDYSMPKMNGVEATAALCAAWPAARIIILTTFDRDDYVFQAVRAGAQGYLLKDTPADRLVSTIRRVHAGEVFIQPEIASRALRELVRPQAQPLEPLSEREREALVLLAQGLSNREIAEKLVITEGTVKNHVSSILAKLQAENRTQAADIARRRGLL